MEFTQPDLKFTQPDLKCRKGHLIPQNGPELDVTGKEKVDEKGMPIFHLRPEVACRQCAIEANAGMPQRRRRSRGEKIEGQADFLNVPVIRIS